jgi:predicted nucleotidyltransferase
MNQTPQGPTVRAASIAASALPEALLQALVAEMDSEEVTAIVLGGSYARGEATPYSDVDFLRLVREEAQRQPKRYFYRNGYLISVPTRTIASYQQSVARPETAIWVVPSMRECRILLDKEGAFAAFQQSLAAFAWEALQKQANVYASGRLLLFTEYVHKVLSILPSKDELALAYAIQELLYVLTEALAVQRGVLIQRGNDYYAQVQETAGLDSAWTRYHRMALGLDPLPEHLSPIEARGIAALRLYQETVRLLREALQPQEREVIEQAVQIIEQARLPTL